MKAVNAKQCRMARAGLGWSLKHLANEAGVATNTLSRFENGGAAQKSTIKAIKDALLASNAIEFRGKDCVCVAEQMDLDV